MLHDVQDRVQRFELLRRGVKLRPPTSLVRVDDLPLQVARVHHVEVHQAQRADARRRQIERQRRTQPAGAHAQHLRRLQLLLALHAHFGQDQVARIARDLFSV